MKGLGETPVKPAAPVTEGFKAMKGLKDTPAKRAPLDKRDTKVLGAVRDPLVIPAA
jgi:hypothetical protein